MLAVFRTGTADLQRLLAQNGPHATAHVSDRVPPLRTYIYDGDHWSVPGEAPPF